MYHEFHQSKERERKKQKIKELLSENILEILEKYKNIHPVEIRRETYDWLPRGLKSRATTLDRGWMIVWHGAHKRPVFIHFPEPLHSLYEKIRRQE